MTTTGAQAAPAAGAPGGSSAWAPLRHTWFRRLWLAQLASSMGGWMQTVAAQWLMLTLTRAALPVALVQTALSLPVVIFGLPAGALGDVMDRRRLLVTAQAVMLVVAAGLAALTFIGLMSPWLLLAFTFLIGAGGALMAPTWMAIQPGLVAREEIPQATAVNAVNINLSRAVGPAIGGVVVAGAGPAAAFGVNAASFLGVLFTLIRWPHRPEPRVLGAEPFLAAMRTGMNYVRYSPPVQAVLVRVSAFLVFAVALWALLPIVAARQLHLGSAGYGMLLGLIGVGAVIGTAFLTEARDRFGLEAVVRACTVTFGLGTGVVAASRLLWPVVVVLPFVGAAWVGGMSSMSAAAQTSLPSWVRARAMAVYLLVFQGTQALGSVLWGAFAQHYGVALALGIAALGVVLGPLAGVSYQLRLGAHYERDIVDVWPEPIMAPREGHDSGPVLVIREYKVEPPDVEKFEDAMRMVRDSRRRFGAHRWNLYHDAADPTRYVETFTTDNWQEHLRMHGERMTKADQLIEDQALRYVHGEPRTMHFISAE
ncbi:MFS transporter [Planosporangium thailandense]|uniref:MFS transporter n=1 Tax=Planosporangium thailandense TaxID=765197 RepID=A0ABX0XZK0_9ACTN|nr:MFS transporter [Planosporangium thailandense]